MADKSKPARPGALELVEQEGGTSLKDTLTPLASGGSVTAGAEAYVGEGPGPELFLLPNPFAVFRGGVDEHNQPLAFIPGVPARDLTQAEWGALTEDQRQICLTTKLYDVAGQAPAEG